MRAPRVLFLSLEWSRWRRARHWSYVAHFGVEAGLRAAGADCLTLPTTWLSEAHGICRGRRFDQVWLEAVHTPLSPELLEWIAGLAPVRVGLLGESLRYTDAEVAQAPTLASRRADVEKRLPYLTHVLAVDEVDAADIDARGLARALWWPQAVPAACIAAPRGNPAVRRAMFGGALYGARRDWLAADGVAPLLVRAEGADGAWLPRVFDDVHRVVELAHGAGVARGAPALRAYVRVLRALRARAFDRWLDVLGRHAAVVSLPHFLKAYPGRVYEGMAAGRPVLSWAVPERPRTRALFEEGVEILVFDDVAALRAGLERIVADRAWADTIAGNARRRLLDRHTSERRVAEILAWLATDRVPVYA